jgi:hypothetical protein
MSRFEPVKPANAPNPNDPDNPIDAAIGSDSIDFGPWQTRLVFFQRIAGGFMIIKGLIHWAILFTGASFYALPVEARGATVFFAVIDLIAGVALWLGSAWGAALWLFAVLSQIVSGLLFLEFSDTMIVLTMIELVLVAVYVVIRYMAYREEQR